MRKARKTFEKSLSAAEADVEAAGWQAVAGILPVPRLLRRTSLGDRVVLAYEDVFATGRYTMLLGDVIAVADRSALALPRVVALVDAVCDSLMVSVRKTGSTAPLSTCMPGLYADRIRPGGRVDERVLSDRLTVTSTSTGRPVRVRDLAGFSAIVNGVPMLLDVPDAVLFARDRLRGDRAVLAALTQGDPTEPNIAGDPLCWLDFQYAGCNGVAGDVAVLLWYLLGMGGWLVPRYQPDVFARTLPLHLPPVASPRLDQVVLDEEQRRVEIGYTWQVGAGRQAAIGRLLDRLSTDLGEAAGLAPHTLLAQLRPFLLLRLLGVVPLAALTEDDRLLLLAKLAEAHSAAEAFTRTSPLPPTETAGLDDRTDDHDRVPVD
ncbi:hypothetical protein [Kitasatospora phosalacinea]|uniref:Uncharacterized protein n=1 Tax=Kitasatospora phosalacinea TaxID=2065 RepID=A0A9W6PN36_9ACTN|nr:hypothetical protein [Kitasatospora phosalacinea]GLW57841.1 hypothetical protein Kpho01_58520 [Kitasatospora phosalacinea]